MTGTALLSPIRSFTRIRHEGKSAMSPQMSYPSVGHEGHDSAGVLYFNAIIVPQKSGSVRIYYWQSWTKDSIQWMRWGGCWGNANAGQWSIWAVAIWSFVQDEPPQCSALQKYCNSSDSVLPMVETNTLTITGAIFRAPIQWLRFMRYGDSPESSRHKIIMQHLFNPGFRMRDESRSKSTRQIDMAEWEARAL